MDKQTVSKLIEDNLHKLYAWSMAKLYDKSEAEDMTYDIICALLKSAHRIENDGAFYGYMWKIARNTLYMKIRSKRETLPLEDSYMGVCIETPEDNAVDREQTALLRRELSLLAGQYRRVTVEYYIYGRSCSEISQKLGISVETVKYCLFKSRKILKEGIDMTREYGEKSYNPATFRINYWGHGSNAIYREIFSRRLPGNILLSAYDKPMSVTEMSVELGVAAPFLEDELEILERHELIRESKGKYQTNIIICTDEYEKRVERETAGICKAAAEKIMQEIDKTMPQLCSLDFYGRDYGENRLKWTFANIAVYHAVTDFSNTILDKFGGFPLLSNNSEGFLFGHDNDYINTSFHGIYIISGDNDNAAPGSVWVAIQNYKMIYDCQNWQPGGNWDKSVAAMTDAAEFKKADENNEEIVRMAKDGYIISDNGSLSPAFPVFSEDVFNKTGEILASSVSEAEECMGRICEHAHKLLKEYSPRSLEDKCGHLAYIMYHLEAEAFIMKALVESGYMSVPKERVNLGIFGVKNN